MCLTRLLPIPEQTEDPQIGYKLVERREDGEYATWDCAVAKGVIHYPLNVWETDPTPPNKRLPGFHESYPIGFHLAVDPQPIRDWIVLNRHFYVEDEPNISLVLIKCEFKEVVAYGEDNFGKVFVARQIKNLGEVE